MFDHSYPLQEVWRAITYDADTGLFYWKVKRANKKPGYIAGHIGPNGYRTIMVNYKSYYAHHLAIAFRDGLLPPKGFHVDHINGDRSDNRLSNLRVTTPSLNGLNRKRRNKNNTSGALGVWQTPSGKFLAYIDIEGKRRRIGLFVNKEDAISARDEWSKKYA